MPVLAFIAACAPGSSPSGNDGSDGNDGDDSDNGGFIDGGFGGFIDGGHVGNGDGGGNPPPEGAACDKIDILFVIDNSGSMGEEQANLAANFPAFAQQIDEYRNSTGQPIDYHVGVTTTATTYDVVTYNPFDPSQELFRTTNTGADGALLDVNGDGQSCNYPAGRKYLQKGDADFAAKLSCALEQGVDGDAMEMPLEAMKRAVVDRAGNANQGFLRPDALLAIVMLTDENDCSYAMPAIDVINVGTCQQAPPVSTYLTALDGVKGQRAKWASAVIAGETDCESDFGSAVKAQRLLDFSAQTGDNAVFSSICAENLSGALTDAFNTFSLACENVPIE